MKCEISYIYIPDSSNEMNTIQGRAERSMKHTYAAPFSVNFRSKRSVALICDKYGDRIEVKYLAVIERGGAVTSAQRRTKFTRITPVEDLDFSEITPHIPRIVMRHIDFSLGLNSLPEKTSEHLYDALLKQRPLLKETIDNLLQSIEENLSIFKTEAGETRAIEKDSVALSLQIFGIDAETKFTEWKDPTTASNSISFLEGFDSCQDYEDDQIAHDLQIVPGWERIRAHTTGIVEFGNSSNKRLVVINTNRKPLEKALGVDLIYYHRKFEAFTLIQYKVMDGRDSDKREYYNPNNTSHNSEISRMRRTMRELSKIRKSSKPNYRVQTSPFYFKLCKRIDPTVYGQAVVTGCYIPLNHWEQMLKDKEFKGPRNGIQIGYKNLDSRYLSKETFTDLLKRGFIGTTRDESSALAPYIEKIVKGEHSVVFAIET